MYNKEQIFEPFDEFDYDSVYKSEEGEEPNQYEQEAIILQKILEFLHPARATVQASTCRLYGLILMLRPSWLMGKTNPTQVDVANMLGVSKSVMNAHVNEVRKCFGFQVSSMRSEEARAKFSKLCKSRASELAEARRQSRKNKELNHAPTKESPTGEAFS
jgi:hypothetical protein